MDMQIKPANKSKRPEKGQSFLGQSCESLPSSRLSTSMPTESAYLDMVPSRSPVPTKPRVEVSPYLDMVPQMSVSSSEAPSYVDMQFNEERKLQSENNHAYIDMTSGSSQSSLKGKGLLTADCVHLRYIVSFFLLYGILVIMAGLNTSYYTSYFTSFGLTWSTTSGSI